VAGAGVACGAARGAVALVFALARVGGRVPAHAFLLAGVVVGTAVWSLIPLLLVLAGRGSELTRILFYLFGTLQNADWTRAALLAPFALGARLALRASARDLEP